MAKWSLKGSLLTYYSLEISNPKTVDDLNRSIKFNDEGQKTED